MEAIMKKSTLTIFEIGHFLEEIIFLVDHNKKIFYCNKEVEHYFGMSSSFFDEYVTENCQLSPYFYELTQAALSNQSQFKTHFLNGTGKQTLIEWKVVSLPFHSMQRIQNEAGVILEAVLLIGKDISEESSKNEKIDGLEMQLNSIIEIMAGNYWWKDINGVYKGVNQALLNLLGVSREEVVGYTDYELPWANTANELVKNDQLVISSGIPQKTIEEIKAANGEIRFFDIFKIPLKNKKGEVVGTIGNSIDITERRQVEKRAENARKLKLKNEQQKITLQEKFSALARNVAHDLKSPLSALRTIINSCDEVLEEKRIMLHRASESIWDISNSLIANYQINQPHNGIEAEPRQALLVSDLLVQLLSEKKVEFRDNKLIRFKIIVSENTQFAFIRTQKSEFRRAISNLINNAVDALKEKKDGKVTLCLTATSHAVRVSIEDNGKGMSARNAQNMERRHYFTEGKKGGHGLGLQQVWSMLESNRGRLVVQSELDHGTTVTLTFPRIAAAKWIAQGMHLTPNHTIVVLDDDQSIHDAWNMHFASLLTTYPKLRLRHFTEGNKALNFINGLAPSKKDNLMLLSDYELLHQSRNGIEIIQASKIKQAILVTSHYANPALRDTAATLKIKILPKQMATVIPIHME